VSRVCNSVIVCMMCVCLYVNVCSNVLGAQPLNIRLL